MKEIESIRAALDKWRKAKTVQESRDAEDEYGDATDQGVMVDVLAHIDAQAAEIERLKTDADQMLTTLTLIRNANPRAWQELACEVTEFERWAKSRANHSILLNAAMKEQQP